MAEISVDMERCDLCGDCGDVCPESAISINEGVDIDGDECIYCGACVEVCGKEAIAIS